MTESEREHYDALVDAVLRTPEWKGTGGMDGLYADFAADVAHAAVLAERERCAKINSEGALQRLADLSKEMGEEL